MKDYTTLQAIWFLLISVLWLGYFVLEGFDFGVGMLMRAVGRSQAERRAVLHSIGPVWDGNEVWLIVAGGATFAAFPQWYATLFSGFYLALFLILVGLIVRNVGLEFWGKGATDAWRTRWEWAIIAGSFLPALLWGVGWANIVHGVPIDSHGEYTGSLFTLLKPYALLGGLATVALFFTHGAIFLSLKTAGTIEERARGISARTAPIAAVVVIAFLAWTLAYQDGLQTASTICAVGAAGAVVAAAALAGRRPGRAFAATCGAIVLLFCTLFTDLFPNVMVSSTSDAFSLTLNEASSSHYTLSVMTVVAVLCLPFVLLYQGWTYWVFRHRVSAEDYGAVRSPVDLLPGAAQEHGGGGPAGA
jgi:cytochrome bd ubiquinol oxidase subunit II